MDGELYARALTNAGTGPIRWTMHGLKGRARDGWRINPDTGEITLGDTDKIRIRATDTAQNCNIYEIVYEHPCQSCSQSAGACPRFRNACIDVSLGLGGLPDGANAGNLNLYILYPTPSLYSPRMLSYPMDHASVEVVNDTNGVMRQIRAPQKFVDIVTVTDTMYRVRYFAPDQVGAMTNGVYALSGTPFVTYTFENPNPGVYTNHTALKVIETYGIYTNGKEYLYIWEPENNDWSMFSGSGAELRQERKVSYIDPGDPWTRVEIADVLNAGSNIISTTERQFLAFPLGELLVGEVTYAGSEERRTTKEYYLDASAPHLLGLLKSQINPDGSWTRFHYDVGQRVTREVHSWKDAPVTAPNEQVRVIDYGYAQDTAAAKWGTPTSTTESIEGVIVAQSYFQVYSTNGERVEVSIRCLDPLGGPEHPSNEFSRTTYYATNAAPVCAGRVKSVERHDGSLSSYAYTNGTYAPGSGGTPGTFTPGAGSALRTEVVQGTVAQPTGIANQTTKRTTILDEQGRQVLTETAVYTGSGYERIDWNVSIYDSVSRLLWENSLKGIRQTNVWGSCCGKERSTDASGIETLYAYDSLGRVQSQTQVGAGGRPDIVTTFTYDADGRMLKQVTAAGSLLITNSVNVYNTGGDLVQSVDQAGLLTEYEESADGRIRSVILPGGATQRTETYLDGQVKTVTDAGGHAEYYDYGVNPDGTRWSKVSHGAADGLHWEKTTTDPLGRTIRVERPAFGGGALTNQSVYNALGQLIRIIQPGQPDVLNEYDEMGRMTLSAQDMDADGQIDLAGPDRVSGSGGAYQELGGDWWRVSWSVLYPVDQSSTVRTNQMSRERLTGFSAGQIAERISIDALGNTNSAGSTLDWAGKTQAHTSQMPGSTAVVVSVTVNGLQISTTSRSGHLTTNAYDALGRLIGTTHPRTGTATVNYNAKGQVEYTEDAAGHRTSYAYDPDTGQPIAVTDALSNTIYTAYDEQGRAMATWGATYPVLHEYDDEGRMIALYTYRGHKAFTSLAEMEASKGSMDKTAWSYDPATGLLVAKTDAAGESVTYSYTPSGQLAQRTWARGVATTYAYDLAGALTNVDYSDDTPDVAYTYDRIGRQKTIRDVQGTRTNVYDPATLNLQSERLSNGAGLDRSYDAIGRPISLALDGDYQVAYGYDSVGRLNVITASVAGVVGQVSYGYAANADLVATRVVTSTAGSAVLHVGYGYEAQRDLITALTNRVSTPGTNLIVSMFAYQNDAVGRRIQMELADESYWNYGYDQRSQVISGKRRWSDDALVSGQQYEYDYDPIGNRRSAKAGGNTNGSGLQTTVYKANALNQYEQQTLPGVVDLVGSAETAAVVTVNLEPTTRQGAYWHKALALANRDSAVYEEVTAVGVINPATTGLPDIVMSESGAVFMARTPETFVYDTDGNLTRDGRWDYEWDGENRLIRMQTRSDISSNVPRQKLEFAYDHMSRRVGKAVYEWISNSWAQVLAGSFAYDGWNLLREERAENSATATNAYVWGLDLSRSLQGAGGVGGLVLAHLGGVGGLHHPAYDGNGNVATLVSATGTVSAVYEYDPFGGLIRATGPAADDNPFQFSSKYTDSETGLSYYGFRFYSPELGRWLSRDPIEEEGGINLYGFVNNNSVDVYDPFGLDFIAMAARPLQGFPRPYRYFNHASIEYWDSICRARIGVEHVSDEFRRTALGRIGGYATRLAGVELLQDNNWSIWDPPMSSGRSGRGWQVSDIGISVIREASDGIRFAAVYEPARNNVRAVRRMWNRILDNARRYRWAEHNPNGSQAERLRLNHVFSRWPNSRYQLPPGNNSNTFGREMLRQVGLRDPNLSGRLPGRMFASNINNWWGNQVPFPRGMANPPPHP